MSIHCRDGALPQQRLHDVESMGVRPWKSSTVECQSAGRMIGMKCLRETAPANQAEFEDNWLAWISWEIHAQNL